MAGSPGRSYHKGSVVHLNESQDMQSFQVEIVRLISSQLDNAAIHFALVNDSGVLQLPVWIRSHLERHPGLLEKLQKGEMVGITATEYPVPVPSGACQSSVVVIPLIDSQSDPRLKAAIALVSPVDGPQLSAEDLEDVRQVAHQVAPILDRLQQIEQLKQENAAIFDAKNTLDAILQMRAHQQVNVAHELRTPLAAIRGYVRMILDGRGGEINDTQREYLRIVNENTNRLITLVSWMSHVAELSAQHMKLSSFDFRGVWQDCAVTSQDQLSEKSLKVVQQIAEEPFIMFGDREKLEYVVKELIRCAVELSDVNGTITAELSHGREGELTFRLSETGASIPLDALRRIFDRPFNAVPQPALPQSEPGNISLSGVYDVVGMHGGRLFVNSTAGQGTTFLFTLPAVNAGIEENSHEQAVNSGRRRR
jgi:signal transduction histidine kinase